MAMKRCSTTNVLKIITKISFLVLIISLFTKITKKSILLFLHNWLLMCPNKTKHCVLWWQSTSFLEKIIWKFLDYIEYKYCTNL